MDFCVNQGNKLTLCSIVKGCLCTCKGFERSYVNIRIIQGLGWNRYSESVEGDSCQSKGEDVDQDQQVMILGTRYVAACSREVEEDWPEASTLMEVGGGNSVGWIDAPKVLTCNGGER